MLEYTKEQFGENVKYTNEIPEDIKGYFNLYKAAAPSAIPDPATLDRDDFSRYYTIFSSKETPSQDALEFTMELANFLSTKGFRYRYGYNNTDALASSVFNQLPKNKDGFKAYESINEESKNVVEDESTYDAQAIASAVYNRYSKELGFKPSSGFKQAEEAIYARADLDEDEKAMAVAIEKAKLSKIKRTSAVFSTVKPGMRAIRGVTSHLIFGGGDLNTPVKFMIVNSPNKAKKVSDLELGQNVTGTQPIMPTAFSDYFGIPLFNVNFQEDRDALIKLVEVLTNSKYS